MIKRRNAFQLQLYSNEIMKRASLFTRFSVFISQMQRLIATILRYIFKKFEVFVCALQINEHPPCLSTAKTVSGLLRPFEINNFINLYKCIKQI